jgi:hypothetical protein
MMGTLGESCGSVQIRGPAFLGLVIISTGDAEGDAVFAGGLRIVWVVPRAAHLASPAGVATCGKTRVNGARGKMKRDRGLLWDWRLT